MKFGLFTSGYQRNPLEHVFEDAKKFGYDYVELWGARPHAYCRDKFTADEVKALIDKYEMPVEVYTPEMNAYPYNLLWSDDRMRKESIEYVKEAMAYAKEIGAWGTLISANHAGYYTSYKDIHRMLLEALQELAAYAEDIQHTVIYEPLTTFESNVTTNANDLAQILDEVNSEMVTGMVDIIVPYVQGESITAYFEKLGDKMGHMHVVDSDGNSESHVCPGEGVLPLPELMEELQERRYEGTITIELVTNYITEPRFYAKRAIENLKGLLK